jgi:hypothetical protein
MLRYKIIELLDRLSAERDPQEKAVLAEEIRGLLDEQKARLNAPIDKKST